MFNDHNIFSNNIYDAVAKLKQLQEAGLKKAMKPEASYETKHQELLRQAAREQAHKKTAVAHRTAAGKMKGSNKAGAHELAAFTHEQQAQDIRQNIEDLTTGDTPKREFWTKHAEDMSPDVHDGPDMDDKGSTQEVIVAQKQNQMKGPITKPFPTPSEMAISFFKQGKK